MKNTNGVIFAVASAGLFSLLSFSAIADSSTPVDLKKMIRANAEKHLAAEGEKYTQIISLSGNRQDELMAKKEEVASAYKKWYDIKSAVVKHYPTAQDYRSVETAALTYSHAHKAFVDLQKNILAQNGIPLDKVATNIVALK
jgi:hypothetical protein